MTGNYDENGKFDVLIVEDKKDNVPSAQFVEETAQMPVKVDLARELEPAEELLEQNEYDHVITDLNFPPKENTYEIDREKIVQEVQKYFEERGYEVEEEDIIGFPDEWEDPMRVDYEEYMSEKYGMHAKIIPYHRNYYAGDLSMPEEARGANGISIAQTCKEQGIPYTVYTSDSPHGHPGILGLISRDLADPPQTLIASRKELSTFPLTENANLREDTEFDLGRGGDDSYRYDSKWIEDAGLVAVEGREDYDLYAIALTQDLRFAVRKHIDEVYPMLLDHVLEQNTG